MQEVTAEEEKELMAAPVHKIKLTHGHTVEQFDLWPAVPWTLHPTN